MTHNLYPSDDAHDVYDDDDDDGDADDDDDDVHHYCVLYDHRLTDQIPRKLRHQILVHCPPVSSNHTDIGEGRVALNAFFVRRKVMIWLQMFSSFIESNFLTSPPAKNHLIWFRMQHNHIYFVAAVLKCDHNS